MACEADSKRNCFTFIWELENLDHWWSPQSFESPEFTVEELADTKCNLRLCFYDRYCDSDLSLRIRRDQSAALNLDCELSFLSSDGSVLHSFEKKERKVSGYTWIGSDEFPSWNEVSNARRAAFLWQNTLRIRCRIWKSDEEFSKDLQYFARTRIVVEKRSFLWSIENFSTLTSDDKQTCEIKSATDGTLLITLKLIFVGLISDEKIRLKIIPHCEKIKTSILKLSSVDASKNAFKCYHDEISYDDGFERTEFTLIYSKAEFMKRKTYDVSNDVLSLKGEYYFCFQTIPIDCTIPESNVPVDFCYEMANLLIDSNRVLIENLKSMLNNITLSDVKLRTKTQTHPAHKCILSSRSTVFAAMFSNEMREKITDCVDIEDLNDDTLTRMLRYIYTADVEDLDWGGATELYEAADKYQILSLKDICSSYIRNNLSGNNACDALVLADLHQDTGLKNFVQDFILRNG